MKLEELDDNEIDSLAEEREDDDMVNDHNDRD